MAVKSAIRKEKPVSREALVKKAVIAGSPVMVKRKDVEEMIDLSLPEIASLAEVTIATVKKRRPKRYYWE